MFENYTLICQNFIKSNLKENKLLENLKQKYQLFIQSIFNKLEK